MPSALEPSALVEAACPQQPHLIVDTDDEIDMTTELPPVEGLVRPVAMKVQAHVARPVAMKVARPIPQRATEQFYDEAYRQGIPAYAVNAAIMDSHDWHRKWTQQDEVGHTMPHDHERSLAAGALPQQYAYQPAATATPPVPDMVLDRLAGARNPSPEWEASPQQQSERKRGRWEEEEPQQPVVHMPIVQRPIARPVATVPLPQDPSAPVPPLLQILWDNENSDRSSPSDLKNESPDSSDEHEDDGYIVAPAAKRPVPIRPAAPTLDEDDDDVYGGGHLNPPPNMLVRPVALRVPRPVIAQLPSSANMEIPKYINADEHSCSKMSTITNSSGLSGGKSTESLGYDFRTDAPQVQAVMVDDEQDADGGKMSGSLEESLVKRRDALLQALAISGGDAQAESFTETIDPLAEVFEEQDVDTRRVTNSASDKTVQGTWLTLTKPTFFGNLGENDAGDPMYTLGRMTFDMFSPTNLVCSLQGNFNSIEIVGDEQRGSMLEAGLVPKGLREEVENREVALRTYNVITAFTIEPSLAAFPEAPNKDVRRPIRGIMTTYGYTLPDPEVPNRHSIWITGGRIEPNDDPSDIVEWKRLFSLHPPKHGFGEQAKLLAVKLLMGATIPKEMHEDGSMEYSFTRPLGGHGVAYVDVLYLDDTLRVVRGHRGTFFIFSRMQNEDAL
ncbi:expressed unknown protein [Seminavis robusta]|uniref:Uncharacterized protein n=1 Tax=Seminavis robusta TaxID=568900 RepID=A0A9N8F332_9STRA|nr:expressed unknown protein [Seminavis robusta]|eukprot:Sro2967_g341150.1 n/a (672) ;mRNA; r:6254-8355